MGAMSRRKGAKAEQDAARWLREHVNPDARRYLAGDGNQPGDLDAIPGTCLEVKSCDRWEPQAWLRQAADEAGGRLPVVWAKPRGVADPGEWIVLLRAKDFFPLLGAGR